MIKQRLLNYIDKVGRSTVNAFECLIDIISYKLNNKYNCL